MVEENVVGPGQFGMTAGAVVPELHSVRVVGFVAADAGRRGQADGDLF